jgi:hypothetical protein
MLKEEIISDTLVKHYSDSGFLIRQIETGALYGEAVDLRPCRYTYEETDLPENPEEPEEEFEENPDEIQENE